MRIRRGNGDGTERSEGIEGTEREEGRIFVVKGNSTSIINKHLLIYESTSFPLASHD